MTNVCPWCGAEIAPGCNRMYTCGTWGGNKPTQTHQCMMIVAERRITELEAALLRIGNINADGQCYEDPDNPHGCVRCRIALEIMKTQKGKPATIVTVTMTEMEALYARVTELEAALHEARGLLDTVCDAYESAGDEVNNRGWKDVVLFRDWYERAESVVTKVLDDIDAPKADGR